MSHAAASQKGGQTGAGRGRQHVASRAGPVGRGPVETRVFSGTAVFQELGPCYFRRRRSFVRHSSSPLSPRGKEGNSWRKEAKASCPWQLLGARARPRVPLVAFA
eukprot:6206158-Pyramimonas_sp.AAC.1